MLEQISESRGLSITELNQLADKLTSYKPPNGIFYILQLEDNTIGMGAFRKLNDK